MVYQWHISKDYALASAKVSIIAEYAKYKGNLNSQYLQPYFYK